MNPQQITVNLSQDQIAQVAVLAQAIQSGQLRNPATAGKYVNQLSYHGDASRPRVRAYMHPAAARKFGAQGREFTGGRVRRDWDQNRQFAQPTANDVHINGPLSQLSIAYQNKGFIAEQVFPNVQVKHKSDNYYKFDKAPWLRDEAEVRAPGGDYPTGGYTLSDDVYKTKQYAFATLVPDEVRDNADNPINPDRNAVNFCTQKLLLKKEKIVATLVFTSGNWNSNNVVTLAGTDQWSDYSNSDPFGDISQAIVATTLSSIETPNTIVMGLEVFMALSLHPDLLERCKYTGTNERPAMVTAQMMAALFGVDRVLVGSAVQDTSKEGGTPTPGFVWGKKFWIGYVADAPALETASAGYIFTSGRWADMIRDDDHDSNKVRCKEEFDAKVTSADSGYLFNAAIA